jgi:dipeptidyl aminopeptidase/acylaminoacyl peptidase
MSPGNEELVGFQVSSDVRVVVVGEAGTDTVGQASELTPHTETLELPVVFGEALAAPQDRTLDGAGAVYYAAYLDTTRDQTCVGGIGVSGNGTPSCVVVDANTLTVVADSPTPSGTILIASVPIPTVRAVATQDDGTETELAITDASPDGYKVIFADLDASDPRELIAYDADDVEIGRITFTTRPRWVRAAHD